MKVINKEKDSKWFDFSASRLVVIFVFLIGIFFSAGCSSGGGGGGRTAPTAAITIEAIDIDVAIVDPLSPLIYEVVSQKDIETLQIKINNIDRTELATLEDGTLTIQPTVTATLPSDYLLVTVTITDIDGYSYTQTFEYTLDFEVYLSSGFSAVPQVGYAPQEITFYPEISAEESIQLYHWDFGDGTKSDSNTSRVNLIGSPVSHTYTQAGEYTVILTIYDSAYQPATSELIVKIYNEPPVVTSISVSPSNGAFPLNSYFSVSATDSEGIQEFLWDFNNDGVVDFNDTKIDENTTYIPSYSSSSQYYTYETAGTYQATVTITDVNGSSIEVTVPTISVYVGPEGTPSVTAYASLNPYTGMAPVNASLSSSWGYYDKWEWDFEGDGTYDYSSTESGSVDHNYTVAGTYYPRIRVTKDGLSSTDSIEITVHQNITLARSADTIDIKQAEAVDINISIAGVTDTTLLIENSRYQPIVTLLEWEERSGLITYEWDGTDADGVSLPEADYYAVLLYKEDGEIKRFDLREERNSYDRAIYTNIDAGDVFAPYLEPMYIEFNLTEAAEVSLDVGPDGYTVTERIKTLLLKQPLGKGSYRIRWAGDANDGTLADLSIFKDKYPSSANYYMTGGFYNKLALNAIFVKSGVTITNLVSDAPVFIPNAIGEDQERNKLSVSFDLSSDATVTLTINDAGSGATIMSKEYTSLVAGSQAITWDGKDENGKYIAPGVYRIGVKATDTYGYTSLTQYALQRIFY